MLDPLFRPRSVAIIGASARYYNIGYRILTNLTEHGFNGPVFPVNPKGGHIRNFKAFPSVLDIPDEVDLAHIVIRNTLVPPALEECGKKGVKAVIINTAGFKEIGGEGEKLERDILEIARKYGMRLFGPNCQGVMNSDPEVSLYANFTFTPLTPGRISIVAQSGGVGEVINNRLYELGAGIRMYASNGNACDIGIPEIMEYMGGDDGTRAIIVHIESLADPAEFMRVASAVTPRKPILAMKTGRTEAGARAVASHTGMLLKTGVSTDLMFDKCGVLLFTSEEELCQTAIGFAQQPLPGGRGVGLITNTGGPAIIATDECIEAGLKIPSLSDKTAKKLKDELYPEASVNNPIDVLATGGPEHFAAAINAMMEDDNIHSILLNFVTPFFVDCEAVAAKISETAKDAPKPILGIVMTNKKNWAGTMKIIRESGIPAYDFPETAARVLVNMTRYSERRRDILETQRGTAVEMNPATVEKARDLAASCEKDRFMPAETAYELLAKYGVPLAKWAVAADAKELSKAADNIGFPLALKVDAKEIIHKTDENALALNIKDKEELMARFDEFSSRFAKHNPRFLLQEYLTGGMEIAMGAKKEGAMGHVLMFGLGGIFVEALKDVSFALAPLTPSEVDKMMRGIRGYALLEGTRGRQGADIGALSRTMLKLSRLVTDIPEIQEMDLNPIIAFPPGKGVKVVDVRIKI